MVWGAPAAGKTAVAREVVARCRARGRLIVHLSSDAVRQAVSGGAYIPQVRPVVYDGLVAMAETALRGGVLVVLDANYLDDERRAQVRALATRLGAPMRSVLVRCALEARLARNRARGAADRVPQARIEAAHASSEAARGEADVVLDTDAVTPEEGAAGIADWLLTS